MNNFIEEHYIYEDRLDSNQHDFQYIAALLEELKAGLFLSGDELLKFEECQRIAKKNS